MSAKKAKLPPPGAVQPMSIDIRKLSRVGSRPGFLDYLVQLWDYRQFIFYDARARVQSGTRKDRLGSAWLLINPIFNGLTYFVIFGLLLQTSHGIENFIGYLVIGVFLFHYSAGAITAGARSIRNGKAVVQAFNFPRAALPLGANIREMLSAVPLILGMMLLIVVVPPAENISVLWLLIIPAVFLQGIFNLGLGLILARIISKVHDVTHLLPFFIRAWMYGSAVFYSYERFIKDPTLLAIMKFNPLYNVIDIVRSSLLYDRVPAWESWATLGVVSLGALLIGFIFFWQGEETYGRD
jgi:teichoic acid transport system permease protein